MEPQRIAYLGTPKLAVPPLLALHSAGYEITMVCSQPDRRRGRGSALEPSPVKAAALELNLPVTSEPDQLAASGATLGVVVAYGELISAELLARLPMINLHFSLLPRWRGPAPVERAILKGDTKTGITLIALDERLDHGPIYQQVSTPIDPNEDCLALKSRLLVMGTTLLLDALAAGLGDPKPQTGISNYAAKVTDEERRIIWGMPSVRIHRQVRAGGAWTIFRGERLKILRAVPVGSNGSIVSRSASTKAVGSFTTSRRELLVDTGQERIKVLEVQAAGRRKQSAEDWMRGARLRSDDFFE